MLARTHLVRIQRDLYDRLRHHARSFLGSPAPELKKYYLEYQRDFQNFETLVTKQELLSELKRSDLIFCGDYHTLSQAQRTVIRLLKATLPYLKQHQRKPVLALEMVRPRHNGLIRRFLSGTLSEEAFLKAIAFHRNWGFSWANYGELFRFAKEEGIAIVGMNGAGARAKLEARDRFAAEVLSKLTTRDPKAVVFALIGDLHLGQSHLPRRFAEILKRRKLSRRTLVLHQNNDRLYWKLVARGLEQRAEAVKLQDGVFCIMNTPPWVKLESHLRWVELAAEVPASPTGRYLRLVNAEATEALEQIDYNDEIRELIQVLQHFLGFPDPVPEDFTVWSPRDRPLVAKLQRGGKISAPEARVLAGALKAFESHFIPRENILFLTRLSLNHAAAQSALFLQSKMSGANQLFSDPDRDFYPFVWLEAMGFLGSKVINPGRKCNGPRDLQFFVRQWDGRKSASRFEPNLRVAKWVLEHLAMEKKEIVLRKTTFGFRAGTEKVLFAYKCSKLLGQLLGQGLYSALVEGKVDRTEIRSLFSTDFSAEGQKIVLPLYSKWTEQLDRFGLRAMNKRDRF